MTERRPYSRTGLNALKARVKVRGLQAIDRRSAAARALLAWRREVAADLGGDAALSAQERAILDIASQTRLLLDSVDAWLFSQPTLVNARRRTLLPVVVQRQTLADALARYLGQLGLKRRPRDVPTLAQYIEQRVREKTEQTPSALQASKSAAVGQSASPEREEHDDERAKQDKVPHATTPAIRACHAREGGPICQQTFPRRSPPSK